VAAVAQQEAEANGRLQASWRTQPMWLACTPQHPCSPSQGQHRQQQAQSGLALPQPDEPVAELVDYRGQLLQVQHRGLETCDQAFICVPRHPCNMAVPCKPDCWILLTS
jgi:hypothetical protein